MKCVIKEGLSKTSNINRYYKKLGTLPPPPPRSRKNPASATATILQPACVVQWTQLVIITSILEKYYSVSTIVVYWTSMIYMVTYIPLIVPASWLLDKKVIGCSVAEPKLFNFGFSFGSGYRYTFPLILTLAPAPAQSIFWFHNIKTALQN